MLTGEIRNQIDRIWDAFWSGGISNPLEVIEQITYLLFLKRLDEQETAEELKANREKKPMQKLLSGRERPQEAALPGLPLESLQEHRPARHVCASQRARLPLAPHSGRQYCGSHLRRLRRSLACGLLPRRAQDIDGRWLRRSSPAILTTSVCHKAAERVRRDDVKALINELVTKDLSRNTVRNELCVIRGIFNEAIEDGIVEVNPAARPGRFTRIAKIAEVKGISLTQAETGQFLQAAKEICPEYHPLFLMALRARAFAAASSSQCSGETSSLGGTSRMRIASSLCSTITCAVSTRPRRARRAGALICRKS